MMLFIATTVNYLDRQVLSLTWKDFIAPEFHWTDAHYGNITAIFSLVYAIGCLFSGRLIDRVGTKKGYFIAIGVWSVGACAHALCGWATEHILGLHDAAAMIAAGGAMASTVAITSVYLFIAARIVLGLGESGNFPAAVKVTAEYFPKKDRAFATSIFNAGSTVGALVAPVSIPSLARYFQQLGVGNGWEMAFLLIGALGFIWMGFWVFMYKKPEKHPRVNAAELAYIQQDRETELAEQALKQNQPEEKKLSFWQCLSYRQAWAFAVGKFMNGFIADYAAKMQEEYQAYVAELTAANLAEAEAFLADNSTKEGILVLDSGVQVEFILDDDSSTAKPAADSNVVVDYKLTLLDGSVMDQGTDVEFNLQNLIPGFAEATMQMTPGDSIRAYIPPAQGYGEMGAGNIEPNSLLIFDITLKEIKE